MTVATCANLDNLETLINDGALESRMNDGHATPHQVSEILEICRQMVDGDDVMIELVVALEYAYEEPDASEILTMILG